MGLEDVVSLSVIIPVYNCAKYIEAAVDSIIKQPVSVKCIVLVNDGSTDPSGVICDELAQKYSIIRVLHQENKGVSIARNNGIEYVLSNTDSEHVMFLDADDVWMKNWLSADIIPYFNNGYDLLAFDYCRADNQLRRRSISYVYGCSRRWRLCCRYRSPKLRSICI